MFTSFSRFLWKIHHVNREFFPEDQPTSHGSMDWFLGGGLGDVHRMLSAPDECGWNPCGWGREKSAFLYPWKSNIYIYNYRTRYIFSDFAHSTWLFSTAMVVYQRMRIPTAKRFISLRQTHFWKRIFQIKWPCWGSIVFGELGNTFW